MDASRAAVVIPVLNGAEVILPCIDSLLAQEDVELEIIVVDNGSWDDTSSRVRSRPGITLLHESSQGAYAARNAGIEHCLTLPQIRRPAVIGFTDADCLASPRWATKLLYALQADPTLGGVGGAVKGNEGDNWIGRYEGRYCHRQEICVRPGLFPPYLTGANMMYRLELLKTLRGFDAALVSGGDDDLGWRTATLGYHLAFVDEAVVFHQGARTLAKFYWQSYHYGRGKRSLWKKHGYSPPWSSRLHNTGESFWTLLWEHHRPISELWLGFVRNAAFLTGMIAGPLR